MTLTFKENRSVELHSRFPEMLQRLVSSQRVNIENVLKTYRYFHRASNLEDLEVVFFMRPRPMDMPRRITDPVDSFRMVSMEIDTVQKCSPYEPITRLCVVIEKL